jgi:hypothetical protein
VTVIGVLLLAEVVNWTTPVFVISKPPPDAPATALRAALEIVVLLTELVIVLVTSPLDPAVPGSEECNDT